MSRISVLVIHNLAIVGLSAYVFSVTESFWSILILLFLASSAGKRD